MTTRSRLRRSDSPEPWYRQINPWVAGSILLVVVVFGGLALISALGSSGEPEPDDLVSGDDPSKGSAEAPVTIVEFSDFQCPACAAFSQTLLPALEDAYIDAGQVRIIFRDYPLVQHEQAGLAAQAAGCAHEQGQFWEMHDLLFARQDEWAGQPNAADLFKGYASLTDVDVDRFGACLDSGQYADEVQEDFRVGSLAGVGATPTFFINGRHVRGIPQNFFELIEEALAAS